MRRLLSAALGVALGLSVAANFLLGWILWRAQGEYRALARQFVRVRQEATRAGASPVPAAAVQPPKHEQTEAAPVPAVPASAAPSAPQSQAPSRSTATSSEVRARYEPRFLQVQADCEGRLNTLLEQAKVEYQQAKDAGRQIDVGAMGAKYFTRAESLQRECDRRVEGLLGQMSGELRSAGLPQDLVAEVRDVYESRVVERRAEILAKTGQ